MVAQLRTPDFFETQVASLISGYNQINDALAAHGILPHHTQTTAITDTGTTNLAAVVVLANSAKALFNAHGASASAHPAADATNIVTAADATSADQTAANTLLNDIKTKFNAHIILRASHRAAPTIAELAADLEALKTAYQATLVKIDVATTKLNADGGVTDTNYAVNFASSNPAVAAVNPAIIKAADASDLATSKTLAAAIVIALNRHFAAGAPKIVSTGT